MSNALSTIVFNFVGTVLIAIFVVVVFILAAYGYGQAEGNQRAETAYANYTQLQHKMTLQTETYTQSMLTAQEKEKEAGFKAQTARREMKAAQNREQKTRKDLQRKENALLAVSAQLVNARDSVNTFTYLASLVHSANDRLHIDRHRACKKDYDNAQVILALNNDLIDRDNRLAAVQQVMTKAKSTTRLNYLLIGLNFSLMVLLSTFFIQGKFRLTSSTFRIFSKRSNETVQ